MRSISAIQYNNAKLVSDYEGHLVLRQYVQGNRQINGNTHMETGTWDTHTHQLLQKKKSVEDRGTIHTRREDILGDQ